MAVAAKNRVRTSWVIALLILVGVIAALHVLDRAGPTHQDATAAGTNPSEASPPWEIAMRTIEPPVASTSMPSPTSELAAPAIPPIDSHHPVRDYAALLDERARAGDAAAACRLGAELDRCTALNELARHRPIAADIATSHIERTGLQGPAADRVIDTLLQQEQEQLRRHQDCMELDLAAYAPPTRYFALAARAGHVPSMLRVLRIETAPGADLVRDPALIAEYRAHASDYLLSLLEAGEHAAVDLWLHQAMRGAASPLLASLPDTMRDVEAIAILQRRLTAERQRMRVIDSRGVDVTPASNPPSVPVDSLRLADAWHARWFSSDPGAGPAPATAPPPPPSMWSLDQYRCPEG
jgi:hypothetical protein